MFDLNQCYLPHAAGTVSLPGKRRRTYSHTSSRKYTNRITE